MTATQETVWDNDVHFVITNSDWPNGELPYRERCGGCSQCDYGERPTKRLAVGGFLTASQLSSVLSRQHTARQVRIAQLEQFIRDHGLVVPPCKEGWELT